jgi:elongation factor Ts
MAEISAKLVKELRDKTGAGMMDCKKALSESGGDSTKATEWLRQKGIATAEKKSGRTAAEGAIGSYIHTGARVGVLVEVNCETDFVARGDLFQDLLRNVAMQIAACPNVEFVSTADIPKDVAEREGD